VWSRASFVLAAHELSQLPADHGVEVAVAGRSNAGKSSAINAISGQARLARISKTPGRTQQLVVFALDGDRRLIDLPGYGYAKVPDSLRAHWRQTLDRYFRTRASLRGLLLAMDIRHPLTPFDSAMLEFCEARALPCHVLLTKADKLTRNHANAALHAVERALTPTEGRCTVQLFSSPAGTGVERARAQLAQWLGL
jgi:GTP-binding protein